MSLECATPKLADSLPVKAGSCFVLPCFGAARSAGVRILRLAKVVASSAFVSFVSLPILPLRGGSAQVRVCVQEAVSIAAPSVGTDAATRR